MSYNYLNLPSMANGLEYTYLSDGTKFSVTKSDSFRVVIVSQQGSWKR